MFDSNAGQGTLYTQPCKSYRAGDSVAQCEIFSYLGTKQTSNCPENPTSCYARVQLASGGSYWIWDHTLGVEDAKIGCSTHTCQGGVSETEGPLLRRVGTVQGRGLQQEAGCW